MSDESTTTIKFGSSDPWIVAKGTVAQQKAHIIKAFGLDAEFYADKTLVEVTVDADMIGDSLRRAARKAASEGYRPKTSIKAPDPPEPEVSDPEENVGPFGLAAFVKTAKSYEELMELHDKNEDQWNDELTQLAKERKRELGIE